MDIAKIRKRLKDSGEDSQRSGTGDQTVQANKEKSNRPDEKSPEISKNDSATQGYELQSTNHKQARKVPVTQQEEAEITGNKQNQETEKRKIKEEEIQERNIEEQIEGEKEEEIVEILIFTLLKEDFAFSIFQLDEIIRNQRITKVPRTPDFIIGITSLRGKVIPVIDLKLKLSLSDKVSFNPREGKILIIKGPRGLIGVAVDKVIGVVQIARSEILPPPSHLSEMELKFIEGIAVIDKRFISIINMEEATALHLK